MRSIFLALTLLSFFAIPIAAQANEVNVEQSFGYIISVPIINYREEKSKLLELAKDELDRDQNSVLLKSRIAELKNKRIAQYKNAKYAVSSAKRVLKKMGTSVSFSTDRKSYTIVLSQPRIDDIDGLYVTSNNMNMKKHRGETKRYVENIQVNPNKSVSYTFHLIEPDAWEKNIHVSVQPVTEYKYSNNWIINKVAEEFVPLEEIVSNYLNSL